MVLGGGYQEPRKEFAVAILCQRWSGNVLEKWTDLNLPVKGKESKDWSSRKEAGKRMWRGAGSQRKARAKLGEHQGIGCQLHAIPGHPQTSASAGMEGEGTKEEIRCWVATKCEQELAMQKSDIPCPWEDGMLP